MAHSPSFDRAVGLGFAGDGVWLLGSTVHEVGLNERKWFGLTFRASFDEKWLRRVSIKKVMSNVSF